MGGILAMNGKTEEFAPSVSCVLYFHVLDITTDLGEIIPIILDI